METLMDHCGNVAAERKLRMPGSKRRPAGSGVEASGGVRARAWQAAAGQQQAASGSVVAASELEHGKLRLASSKRRRARVTEDGGGVRAADRMLQLPSSKRCPARVTEDGGGVRAADRMLRLPSSKGCAAAWPRLVAASAPRMAT
ncbi:hypothetical protein PR001_g9615, partial [Phytophthora rubi]